MEDRKLARESRERAQKEWDDLRKQMKETDRKIGELGNRFGELAEHLVAPGIMEKFNELGFFFNERSLDVEIRDTNNPSSATEIDILLENGDIVIAIEVKSKPKLLDIEEHIKRMDILRQRADRRGDKRKYQGAIAGAIVGQNVRQQIIKSGFYLIEQTGDTVKLSIPQGFIPKEW